MQQFAKITSRLGSLAVLVGAAAYGLAFVISGAGLELPEPINAASPDGSGAASRSASGAPRDSGKPSEEDAGERRERFWPQWRGPLATGVAPHADPPVQWSETKNVRWKVDLPGEGHSTPIVWDDRILLTAAIPAVKKLEPRYSGRPGAHDNRPVQHRYRFVVLALRRSDGETLWQSTVHKELPHEGGHQSSTFASNSPVTDGEHVFAFFGSRGLFGLDTQGEVLWSRDFGDMHTKHGHGEGSSPALHEDTLIVNWDHQGQSFIAALDKNSGETRWKRQRDEPSSWATPIIVERERGTQVIVSGTHRIRAYDLTTGEVIWKCGGLSANIVASPVSNGEMVFAGSSYRRRALLAIRLDGARGDVTGTDHVAWKKRQGTPYVPSPLLYGDALYYTAHYQGILSRVDAATGAGRPGAFRVPQIRNVYASPVGAAGRVYLTGRDGTTVVISHSDEPKILAINPIDEPVSASLAIAGRELFIRSSDSLYCIARK